MERRGPFATHVDSGTLGLCQGDGRSFAASNADEPTVEPKYGWIDNRPLAGYLMTFMQKTIDGRFVEEQNMIVDNIRGGQFNIFWCSLDCMRKSLNDIVDQLERQLQD